MDDDIELYKDLANAIIILAAKDYRKALKKIKKNPHNKNAIYTKEEVERFFRSDWFSFLSDISGEQLLKRLCEEQKGSDQSARRTYLRATQ